MMFTVDFLYRIIYLEMNVNETDDLLITFENYPVKTELFIPQLDGHTDSRKKQRRNRGSVKVIDC